MTNESIVLVYMTVCIVVIASCLILLGFMSDANLKKSTEWLTVEAILREQNELLHREKLELVAQLNSVCNLHYERPHNLNDFVHYDQTEFPNLCNHCKSRYPCATIRAIELMEGD